MKDNDKINTKQVLWQVDCWLCVLKGLFPFVKAFVSVSVFCFVTVMVIFIILIFISEMLEE
jgi:uncharacterized membrane protein